jgi:hypothetical protein
MASKATYLTSLFDQFGSACLAETLGWNRFCPVADSPLTIQTLWRIAWIQNSAFDFHKVGSGSSDRFPFTTAPAQASGQVVHGSHCIAWSAVSPAWFNQSACLKWLFDLQFGQRQRHVQSIKTDRNFHLSRKRIMDRDTLWICKPALQIVSSGSLWLLPATSPPTHDCYNPKLTTLMKTTWRLG